MTKQDIEFLGSDFSTNFEARKDFNKSLRQSGVREYKVIPPENALPNLFKLYNDGSSVHLNWTESNGTNHDNILGGVGTISFQSLSNITINSTNWGTTGGLYHPTPALDAGRYFVVCTGGINVTANTDRFGFHSRLAFLNIAGGLGNEIYLYELPLSSGDRRLKQFTLFGLIDVPQGAQLAIDAFKEQASNFIRIFGVNWYLIKVG